MNNEPVIQIESANANSNPNQTFSTNENKVIQTTNENKVIQTTKRDNGLMRM